MTTNTFAAASLSRRRLLGVAGTGALAAALAVAPNRAHATAAEADAQIKTLVGDKMPTAGNVTVDGPEIAENGNTVPITISVDSPMTADNYVKTVMVLADGNPAPNVATFHFTPHAGKAYAKFRIRLAQTQKVRAIALMSDGSTFSGEKEIKVTIGGCGG